LAHLFVIFLDKDKARREKKIELPAANFAVHSLLKVLFAFFGLALANENGQDRFFFFEDIRLLIVNSVCL